MSNVLTGQGLVDHGLSVLGTFYFYGAKMQVLTESFMKTMRTMYPTTVTANYVYKARQKDQVGKMNVDCSGLISSYTKHELGSAQLYQQAKTRLNVTDYKNWANGVVAWRSGHVGIFYESNGRYYVVEAKGIDYGVVITEFNPANWSAGLTFSWLVYDYAVSVADNATKPATNPYPVPARTLRRGSTGSDVKWLQFELNEAGYSITIDGDFGPNTYNAVTQFQKSTKLTVDGIVGQNTRKALQADNPAETQYISTANTKKFGIDVAKWQGNINWSQVKAEGRVDFAILKVTQKNNSIEDSFIDNYNGARSNGIPVDVYRYVYASTVPAAVTEAQGVLTALAGKELDLSNTIWLDLEDDSIRKLSRQAFLEIIEAEASVFSDAGYDTGIYCNRDWYEFTLPSDILRSKYRFWIAKYGANTGNDGYVNRSDEPTDIAWAWQYTSRATVKGVQGFVDMNMIYNLKDVTEKKPDPSVVGYFHVQLDYKPGVKYEVTASSLYVRTKPFTAGNDLGLTVIKGDILGTLYKNTVVTNKATMRLENQIWMYIGLNKDGKEQWICADNGEHAYVGT